MADTSVLRMSKPEKVAEAIRRSLPQLPLEARHVVEGMLRPETIAVVSGTLVKITPVGGHPEMRDNARGVSHVQEEEAAASAPLIHERVQI